MGITMIESEFVDAIKKSTTFHEGQDGGEATNLRTQRRGSVYSIVSEPADSPACLIIHPQHPCKVSWDVLISFLILYSALLIPFRVGFDVEAEGANNKFDIAVEIVFTIDIFLTFITGYKEQEALISDRCMIARRYISSFFFIDLVSILPIDYVLEATRPSAKGSGSARIIRVLRLFRLMKLARLFRLRRLTTLLEEQLDLSLQMLDMIKVMGKVIFLVHMLACVMFWIAIPVCGEDNGACEHKPNEPATNWVQFPQVDQFDASSRYLASFYLITTTLMAVGFGDLSPVNIPERLFIIAVQLTGAVAFGFILSCITAVIETSNPRELERKKQMSEIKDWIHGRDLPIYLKSRVWAHFSYVTSRTSAFKDDPSMIQYLPSNLRKHLVEKAHSEPMTLLQAVFGIEEKLLVTELAVQMSPVKVSYGVCILEIGELLTEFFIVSSGRMDAVVIENHKHVEALVQIWMNGVEQKRTTGLSSVDKPVLRQTPMTDFAPAEQEEAKQKDLEMSRARSKRATLMSTRRSIQKPTLLSNPMQLAAQGLGLYAAEPEFLTEFRGSKDHILCGIYRDFEVFGHFPISPVKLQGGTHQTELYSVHQYHIDRALATHPAKLKEFEESGRVFCQNLADAATSTEWTQKPQALSNVRLKGLIVFNRAATDVRAIPKEILQSGTDTEDRVVDQNNLLVTRKRDTNGTILTSSEIPEEIMRRWIFVPSSQRKIMWDLLLGAIIVYSVLVITYRFSFNVDPDTSMTAVDGCVDVLFLVDMIVSFRTAFLDADGVLNTLPWDITRNYLKGWFIIDFLSTAPIDRIVEAGSSETSQGDTRAFKLVRFARLFRLLKLARMLKLFKLLQNAESNVEISPVLIKIGSLCLRVCFLAHMVACIWHYITTVDQPDDACEAGKLNCTVWNSTQHCFIRTHAQTWLSALPDDADADSIDKIYIAALYWVFTTMTTVGYGDIIPVNNLERVYAVAVMIFGATVFGYIVGSVAELANSGRQDPVLQCLIMLRHYSEEQNLSRNILRSIRRHYEFWYQENSPFEYEVELLQRLPAPLRKDVILYIHRHIFESLAIFRAPLPPWLQAIIVRLLEPSAIGGGEMVIHPGEGGMNQDIFFVHEGSCEVFLDRAAGPGNAPPPRWAVKAVAGKDLKDRDFYLLQ
jgi:hypothetical protein